jgi:hypothetical protein
MALPLTNLGVSAKPDIADTTNVLAYSNASWTPPTTGLLNRPRLCLRSPCR